MSVTTSEWLNVEAEKENLEADDAGDLEGSCGYCYLRG